MAYTKTTWVNDTAPAINATNLNKMEQGIYDAHDTADAATSAISTLPKLQYGYVTVSSIAANSYKDATITFSPAFSSTPVVVATPYTSATALYANVQIASISASGCTIRVFNSASAARSPGLYWIAVL